MVDELGGWILGGLGSWKLGSWKVGRLGGLEVGKQSISYWNTHFQILNSLPVPAINKVHTYKYQ
jgi:hypothetical protein